MTVVESKELRSKKKKTLPLSLSLSRAPLSPPPLSTLLLLPTLT